MFCDELKIGACRNGVLLALFGAISLGPVICSAQAALPQKQEAPTPAQCSAALLKKAEAGDAEAQFLLGSSLSHFVNFDGDDANYFKRQGVEWLKKSAQQGHAGARLKLAQIATVEKNEPNFFADTLDKPTVDSKAPNPGPGSPKAESFVDFNKPNAGDNNQRQRPAPNPFDQFDKPGTGDVQTEGSPKPAGLFDDILKGTGGVHSEPSPPRSLLVAAGLLLLSVILTFLCAHFLWTVLGKNVKGSTPLATGRRWMNWVAMLTCLQPLGKFFSLLLGGFGNPVNVLMQGVIATTVFAGAAFGLGALWAYFHKRKSNNTGLPNEPKSPPATEDKLMAQPSETSQSPIETVNDEAVWAKVMAEFDSAHRRPGLWAKVFSDADGNEALAKARYLKVRVQQLVDEERGLSLDRR